MLFFKRLVFWLTISTGLFFSLFTNAQSIEEVDNFLSIVNEKVSTYQWSKNDIYKEFLVRYHEEKNIIKKRYWQSVLSLLHNTYNTSFSYEKNSPITVDFSFFNRKWYTLIPSKPIISSLCYSWIEYTYKKGLSEYNSMPYGIAHTESISKFSKTVSVFFPIDSLFSQSFEAIYCKENFWYHFYNETPSFVDVPYILSDVLVKNLKEKDFWNIKKIIDIAQKYNMNKIIPTTDFMTFEEIIFSYVIDDNTIVLFVRDDAFSLILLKIDDKKVFINKLTFLDGESRNLENFPEEASKLLHFDKQCDKEYYFWQNFWFSYNEMSSSCEKILIKYLERIFLEKKNLEGRVYQDIVAFKKLIKEWVNYLIFDE